MDDKKLLKALHDYYEESIFITDGNGDIIFANKVAARRLGVPCDQLEGKNVRELMEDGVYTRSTVLESIREKKAVVGSLGGETSLITYSNSVPVLDEDGNVELVVTNNMSSKHNKEWESIINDDRRENTRLRRERDFHWLQDKRMLVANSPVMKSIIDTIEAIAPTESSIVVLGDSGTGKDMIARMIHEKSNRKDNAYISINCAAMPENLLESELFGYESGAFTGASREGKIGLFEATSGGTLFLDEVGEMSLALQSKLLRVLENKEIRRVGGVENIPVDVRVICATNRDLEKLVEEKAFRDDLYYRLSVFTIKLPPLIERKEDIIPIAQMFLDELNAKYGTHKVLADVSVETMLNYYWPGNIRELRNVIERIYVVSPGNELIFTPIPTAEYGEIDEAGRPQGLTMREFLNLKEFMDYAEQEYIKKIMRECGGSINKTSAKLGIHRSVLYRKLHKK